jgi:hypothetical protein
MIELIKMKVGHAPRVNALATLFDRRTKYSASMLDEIRGFFGDQMLQTVIRLNVTLKRAVSEGVPVIDFDKTSNGAKDYTALSCEILRLNAVEDDGKTIAPFVPIHDLEKRESALPTQEVVEKSSERDIKEMAFTIEAPAAKDIYIVGDFNDWKINDESRLGRCENGCWEKRMGLAQGRYRYQFVVDGNRTLDSKNPDFEPNPFGTFDSVMKI